MYVSNESNTNFDVFFDDLRITHTKGRILQEDHYYPFGMNISALSSTAPLSKPNKYKLSGNEEQTEFDFNVYDFNARFYDGVLGRFMNIDPMADQRSWMNPYNYVQNNPNLRVDPSGMLDSDLSDAVGDLWARTGENGATGRSYENGNAISEYSYTTASSGSNDNNPFKFWDDGSNYTGPSVEQLLANSAPKGELTGVSLVSGILGAGMQSLGQYGKGTAYLNGLRSNGAGGLYQLSGSNLSYFARRAPLSSRTVPFSTIGRYGGALSRLGTMAAIGGLGYDAYKIISNDPNAISTSRFGYRFTTTGIAMGVTRLATGFAGLGVSGLAMAGEFAYDNGIVPMNKHYDWQRTNAPEGNINSWSDLKRNINNLASWFSTFHRR